MTQERKSLTKNKSYGSKSKTKQLAMARLQRKETQWVGKLQPTRRVPKCKQTLFMDSDNSHSVSEPVPSTSHDMSASECVPSDSSDCVEKEMSKPVKVNGNKRKC